MNRFCSLRLGSIVAFFAAQPLAACASQSPDAPAPASDPLRNVQSAQLGGATALDLLKGGGTYMFSLDESDPAARFRSQCATESPGDTAKADACYGAIRAVGSNEGMRFVPDAAGHLVWTSFGQEEGKEVVYIQVPLSLAADGDRAVVASFAEAPHGPQLAGEPNWASTRIRIELPDATTMVMNDPSKGRLVFHRVEQ
jgi:hypothetical protein